MFFTISLRYIAKVTNTSKFSPCLVEHVHVILRIRIRLVLH